MEEKEHPTLAQHHLCLQNSTSKQSLGRLGNLHHSLLLHSAWVQGLEGYPSHPMSKHVKKAGRMPSAWKSLRASLLPVPFLPTLTSAELWLPIRLLAAKLFFIFYYVLHRNL